MEFKGEENSIFLNFGKVIVKGVGKGHEGEGFWGGEGRMGGV